MKRIVGLLIAVCLLFSCAFANNFYEARVFFDTMAESFGLDDLPEEYETTDKTSYEMRAFLVPPSMRVVFFCEGETVTGGTVICYSESAYLDFLALSSCMAYAVLEKPSYSVMGNMMWQFFDVRSGKEPYPGAAGDYIYEMHRLNENAINFLIMKEE